MTITTQAAVVESGGAPFTLADVELDEPRPDEVLVRMTAAGLCHTDLGVASGGLPFPLPGVLGHEGAGVVERVGVGGHLGGAGRPRAAVVHLLRWLRATAAAATRPTAPPGCRTT